jgi:hypothetical protein
MQQPAEHVFTCDAVHLCALQHAVAEAHVQEQPRVTTARLLSSTPVQHQQALGHSLQPCGGSSTATCRSACPA